VNFPAQTWKRKTGDLKKQQQQQARSRSTSSKKGSQPVQKPPNTKYYKKLTQKERIKSCASENENRSLSKKCQNRVVNTYFAQAEKKSCYASERAHEKFRCTPNVCPTAPLLRENFIFSPIT